VLVVALPVHPHGNRKRVEASAPTSCFSRHLPGILAFSGSRCHQNRRSLEELKYVKPSRRFSAVQLFRRKSTRYGIDAIASTLFPAASSSFPARHGRLTLALDDLAAQANHKSRDTFNLLITTGTSRESWNTESARLFVHFYASRPRRRADKSVRFLLKCTRPEHTKTSQPRCITLPNIKIQR